MSTTDEKAAQCSATPPAPRARSSNTRSARRGRQCRGRCSFQLHLRSRRGSWYGGDEADRPLHSLTSASTTDAQRPRFIPWSLDTQLSALVHVKEGDQGFLQR